MKRITLELRNDVIARAVDIAARTQRRVEDVLAEWLDRYAEDLPVESLSDEQVLALCRFEMNIIQKQELATLLHTHHERALTDEESARLDDLLNLHRRSMVRKARALQVAASRGLSLPN
ncbi:MAG: hypothetical protein SF029_00340 [bacterium]|nr:hypothetical protein [bacterium]